MKNAAAPLVGSRFIACLVSILLFCIAAPAATQFAQLVSPVARDPARERAVKRCKENRGADCESWEGLKEWREQERPLTAQEQATVAGARQHREACAKNKKAANC